MIALPLADAQMLLEWMDETFGNDSGTDWHDEDAAAVGDALNTAIENFKRMRAAVAGVLVAPEAGAWTRDEYAFRPQDEQRHGRDAPGVPAVPAPAQPGCNWPACNCADNEPGMPQMCPDPGKEKPLGMAIPDGGQSNGA